MKKMKRSARLVEMTQYLLSHPHTLIPLSVFVERHGTAKSSISEDLGIIKDIFADEGVGDLGTMPGAAGGVKFIPRMLVNRAKERMMHICSLLEQPDRLLPGGYLYMTDLLGQPELLNDVGRMFATAFADRPLDVVMTVETKGIPLACATANYLNLPVVIVRRDHKVTEGSAVSINYISGSTKRIQTMSLPRRALQDGANVLIIDDFMKAGGTVHGMVNLLSEFKAKVQGVGVFVESEEIEEHLVEEYVSLAKLSQVDVKGKRITIQLGNYFENETLGGS